MRRTFVFQLAGNCFSDITSLISWQIFFQKWYINMLLKLDKLYLVFVEELLIKICPVVFDFKIKEGEMILFFLFSLKGKCLEKWLTYLKHFELQVDYLNTFNSGVSSMITKDKGNAKDRKNWVLIESLTQVFLGYSSRPPNLLFTHTIMGSLIS